MKVIFVIIIVISVSALFLLFSDTKEKTDKPAAEEKTLKEKLTPLEYNVTQECGTEPPFNNKYWDNKEPGIYVDIISGEPLFSSKDKFKSGSGWPSFTQPLAKENVKEKTDTTLGMVRTEVRSSKADSHLGHVFDDGPNPTGLRYCINSASLRFIPVKDLEKEGYAEYLSLFGLKPEKPLPEKKAAFKDEKTVETAVFAAGCFWGVEAVFDETPGVLEARSGYIGGGKVRPSYSEVCRGYTGHTEAVEVRYDPEKVTYEKLLDLFWRMHNPTYKQKTQYKSAVFYTDEKQKELAEKSMAEFNKKKVFPEPAATEVLKAGPFWPAEDYHQDYYKKKGMIGCHKVRDK